MQNEEADSEPSVPDDDELPEDVLPMEPEKSKTVMTRTSGRNIMAKEKAARALSLRQNGASFAEIARAVKYSSANYASQVVRKELQKLTREPADELRALQYERLNTMLLVLQPQIMGGDKGAIQTALSVMDRMNGLYGLLNPEEQSTVNTSNNYIVVIDGDEDEYVRRLQAMAGEREHTPEELTQNETDDIIDVEEVE